MAALNRTLTLSSSGPLSPLEANERLPPGAPSTDFHCPESPSPETWLSGSSAAIANLRAQVRRVAPYFRTALLTGERGCGEKSAAHVLHQLSPLAHQPFLVFTPAEAELRFNPESSLESVSAQGMLYLPQPERLPRTVQAALLRLLRERGSNAPRIVAFAERGLRSLVSTGGFSAELADTLGALRITLPPLRERREDIPALLLCSVKEIAAQSAVPPPQLAADLLQAAMNLPWPGNFLQLNTVANSLTQGRPGSGPLHAADLEAILESLPTTPPRDRRELRMLRLDDIIQEHIRAVLFACNGNKLRTAEVLGISRSTLYRMLESPAPSGALPASSQKLQMAG